MRKILLTSSLVVAATLGVAGGVSQATDGEQAAAPSTTLPGSDIFADLGLTPEQSQCLVENVGSVDLSDTDALLALVTECGITIEQLLDIGGSLGATTTVGGATTAPADTGAPTSTTALGQVPAEIDPATAAAVLALLGLDQNAVDCLVGATVAATPGDDAQAAAALEQCGISVAAIVDGIVAIDAAAGDTATVSTDGAASTTLAVGDPTTSSAGNTVVDQIQTQLESQGITLDDAQVQCLVDNVTDIDTSDFASITAVLETCGIDLTDLVGG